MKLNEATHRTIQESGGLVVVMGSGDVFAMKDFPGIIARDYDCPEAFSSDFALRRPKAAETAKELLSVAGKLFTGPLLLGKFFSDRDPIQEFIFEDKRRWLYCCGTMHPKNDEVFCI